MKIPGQHWYNFGGSFKRYDKSFEEKTKTIANEYRLKRKKYYSSFALQYMGEMKILQKGGILGTGDGNESWRNISEHVLTEGVVADVLAEALSLSPIDRKKIVKAAILHDWYKRREIEAFKKFGGYEGYLKAGAEDGKLLREYGVPEELIELAHSNIPRPDEVNNTNTKSLASRSLLEKLMHYIDIITDNTDLVGYDVKIGLARTKPAVVNFTDGFKPLYNGISLLDVQLVAAKEEEAELEKMLNVEKGGLIKFIQNKIKERIQNVQVK
jgi:hypothetical protein